jgi:hypothetical protein
MPCGLDRRAASTLVRLAVFAVAGIAAPGIQPSRLAAAVLPVRELVGEDHRVGMAGRTIGWPPICAPLSHPHRDHVELLPDVFGP